MKSRMSEGFVKAEAEDYGFGRAPIKMEGGIADPDEFTFECGCEKCKERYRKWKEKFDAEQKTLRGA